MSFLSSSSSVAFFVRKINISPSIKIRQMQQRHRSQFPKIADSKPAPVEAPKTACDVVELDDIQC